MNGHRYNGPGALVLMVGAPGSGKSGWVAKRFEPTQVVCLDTLRGQLTDNESDMAATPEAVDIAYRIIGYRTALGLTTVLDATNASLSVRMAATLPARKMGVPVVAVVLDVPVDVCVERQAGRARKVPERVVRSLHARILAELAAAGDGCLQPAVLTRVVSDAGDFMIGHVPGSWDGAPWLL